MGPGTQVVAALLGSVALAAQWVPHAVPPGTDAPAPQQVALVGAAPVGERAVAVAPVAGAVVRAFEQPDGPYGRGHRGVDLAVTPGEPVRAAMTGTVRFAGRVAGESWITVAHRDGLQTTYGGVAPAVTAGEPVATGQRLGTMRAGRRTLDWGARLGRDYLDPLGLLAGWRVRLVAPTQRTTGA